MDCSPPGSSVHGISQARKLEWVAFPSPGDLPDPGITSASSALAGRFFTAEPPGNCRDMNFVVVQSLSHVQVFATPQTRSTTPAFLCFTISWSLLKLMSIELVKPSNHLILCHPFSFCLQFFSASGSFQTSQFFASGSQSIGVSASISVLPMNIQD